MKYERLFYDACASGYYYMQTLGRGICFYTASSEEGDGIFIYLQAYLEGKSDPEIWQLLQDFNPLFNYYDFNKSPSQQ
jgi:hypothetical protein